MLLFDVLLLLLLLVLVLQEPFHPSMLVRNRTVPMSWGTALVTTTSSSSHLPSSLPSLFETNSGSGSGATATPTSSSSSKDDDTHRHRGLLGSLSAADVQQEQQQQQLFRGWQQGQQQEQQQGQGVYPTSGRGLKQDFLARKLLQQQQQQRQQQQQTQQQHEDPPVLLPPALFRWDAPPLTKSEFDALPTRIRTHADHTSCVQCTDMVSQLSQ